MARQSRKSKADEARPARKEAFIHLSFFWKTVVFFVVVYYGGLVLLLPMVSQWVVDVARPLPMPSASLAMYRIVILAGLAIYVSSSERRRRDFLLPLYRFFSGAEGRGGSMVRWSVLIVIPLAVAAAYFVERVPRLSSPIGVRIQHPTMPGRFAKMESPARFPSGEAVRAFMSELAEEEGETPSSDAARERLIKKHTREGAVLFAVNCRPCHGMQADGAGPMARGFRLRPANFRDPGLLPTVVEPYAFWRVSKGGPGLPAASTPWDSAMPIWELDLSEEDRWKLLLGEYFIAGVGPREPEKSE